MAVNNGNNQNGHLNAPPPQTVHGVILYHPNPEIDNRIREVRVFREAGYDVDIISKMIDRGQAATYAYLRQIRIARLAYIAAFPEDFDTGLDGLRNAILDRRDFDAMMRRELTQLGNDKNPSNRIGLLKIIMRNMRETEELAGLLVQRIEHGGEVTVREQVKDLLDHAPAPVREAYLDALSAIVDAAEQLEPTRSQPE